MQLRRVAGGCVHVARFSRRALARALRMNHRAANYKKKKTNIMQRFSSFFCLFAFFSIILCAERACLRLRDAFEGKRRKPLAGVLCLTTLLAYSGLVQTSFLFSAFLLFFAFPRPHVISLAAPACALPRCTLGFFFKKNFHLIVVQFLFLCTGLPTSHLVFFFFLRVSIVL